MLIYAAVLYLFIQQYLRSIILIYAAALIFYSASCEVPASIINQIIGMRIRDRAHTKPTRHGKLFMTHHKHVTKGSCAFNNAATN